MPLRQFDKNQKIGKGLVSLKLKGIIYTSQEASYGYGSNSDPGETAFFFCTDGVRLKILWRKIFLFFDEKSFTDLSFEVRLVTWP